MEKKIQTKTKSTTIKSTKLGNRLIEYEAAQNKTKSEAVRDVNSYGIDRRNENNQIGANR